jgi:hypothetical protein
MFFYRVLFRRSFFDETLPPSQSLMIAQFISKRTGRKRTHTGQIEQKKEREQFLCTKRGYPVGLSAYASYCTERIWNDLAFAFH